MPILNDSPSKRDTRLLSLALTYRNSKDARARNMTRGRAQRLINQFYRVPANREAVWAEWCRLADPNGWLSR